MEFLEKLFSHSNKYYTIIGLVALLVYGSTVNNEFVLDDNLYIKNHKSVQKGLLGLGEIFSEGSTYQFNTAGETQPFRPITLSTFAIGKAFYGNSPFVEHLVNVLLFSLLCMLLFFLLRQWIPKQVIPGEILLLSVLLFVVHPIHSEVVSNIKSRDEILALLFGVLLFILLFKFIETKSKKILISACLVFLVSLLSKEVAVTFLAVIPLSIYFFNKKSAIESLKLSLPFIIPFVCYLFYRSLITTGVSDGSEFDMMNNILNSATSHSEKFATIASILFNYLKLLVLPSPLLSDYSYSHLTIQNWSSVSAIAGVILYIGLLTYAIYAFRTRCIYSFFILYFIITLSIFTNIVVPSGTAMAERFLFTPSLAYCILLPIGFFEFQKRSKPITKSLKSTQYVILVLILFFGIKSVVRSQEWKNNFTLFKADIENAPKNARMNYWLGLEYKAEAGKAKSQKEFSALMTQSEKYLMESIKIYPKYRLGMYNLGVLYMETRRSYKAQKVFKAVIKQYPNDLNSLNNLGVLLFNNKDFKTAIPLFKRVVQLDSLHVKAMGNLGASYQRINNMDSANYWYNFGLSIDPENVEILNNLKIGN